MVDLFEDGSPRRDADTCADEDGNFVLEDVFGGCSVGAVNAEGRHLLSVLKRDFVHAHRVELVVELGLRLAGSESISERTCEIADLTDVDGNVGVFGARCDGKWMPLVVADFWAVEEQPLSGLVLHGGLDKLDLDGICNWLVLSRSKIRRAVRTIRMTDNLHNFCLSAAADLTVQTIHQVQTTSKEFPSPTFVANAVVPEVGTSKRRMSGSGVTDEAAGGMRVHPQQERNEEVVSVPESLERLLPDPVVCCGVHEQHAEQHDMASDATSLGVVDLKSNLRSNLTLLYIEEAERVSCCYLI